MTNTRVVVVVRLVLTSIAPIYDMILFSPYSLLLSLCNSHSVVFMQSWWLHHCLSAVVVVVVVIQHNFHLGPTAFAFVRFSQMGWLDGRVLPLHVMTTTNMQYVAVVKANWSKFALNIWVFKWERERKNVNTPKQFTCRAPLTSGVLSFAFCFPSNTYTIDLTWFDCLTYTNCLFLSLFLLSFRRRIIVVPNKKRKKQASNRNEWT